MIKKLSLFAIKYGLMFVVYCLVRLYMALVRIKVVNEKGDAPIFKYLQSGQKMIVAIWHQRILFAMRYSGRFRKYKPSAMISQSRDGELVADIFKRFNFRPVRGSSSRGGKQALAAMVTDLEHNQVAVHVLDGPRGPAGLVKAGLIVMAQLSGVPIFPVYLSVDRAWVLNSWDQTLIPKPFSRVSVRWGDPIHVPACLNDEDFETIRKQTEDQMKNNQIRDDQEQGWEGLL